MEYLLNKIMFENSFSNYLRMYSVPGTDYTVVDTADMVPAFIKCLDGKTDIKQQINKQWS